MFVSVLCAAFFLAAHGACRGASPTSPNATDLAVLTAKSPTGQAVGSPVPTATPGSPAVVPFAGLPEEVQSYLLATNIKSPRAGLSGGVTRFNKTDQGKRIPILLYAEGFPPDQVEKAVAVLGNDLFEIVSSSTTADVVADLDSSKVPDRGCSTVSQDVDIASHVIVKAVIHVSPDRSGCPRAGEDALAIALAHELGHAVGLFGDIAHTRPGEDFMAIAGRKLLLSPMLAAAIGWLYSAPPGWTTQLY